MAERSRFSSHGTQVKVYSRSFSMDGQIVHIGSPGDTHHLIQVLDRFAEKVRKETRREIREALGIKLKHNVER